MRVLVVGGQGYIGSVLCPLLRHEHEVLSYDIASGADITGDVRDLSILGLIANTDAVIYLAGITNNDDCVRDLINHLTVNKYAFIPIMLAAKRGGKRFIYASSVAAYGSSVDELTEESPLLPTTPYGIAKADCEGMMEAREFGVRVRSASVCGPSPKLSTHLTINKMVHDGLNKGVITVNGGSQTRSHVHIKDLCAFYKLILELPLEKIQGQVFNVVTENQTVTETANLVSSIIGCRVEAGPRTDDRSYKVSGEKAKTLGFWPQWTIADAIKEMHENNCLGKRRFRLPTLRASDSPRSREEIG